MWRRAPLSSRRRWAQGILARNAGPECSRCSDSDTESLLHSCTHLACSRRLVQCTMPGLLLARRRLSSSATEGALVGGKPDSECFAPGSEQDFLSKVSDHSHPLIKGISKLLSQPPTNAQYAAPDVQKFYNKKNNPTLLCFQRTRKLKKRQPEEMSASQYLYLMTQWTRRGGAKIGQSMFEQMLKVGVFPVDAYATMIKHFVMRARGEEGADESLRQEEEGADKCILEALKYLHEMRAKGITPNGMAYEPLVEWFLENDKKAEFDEMLEWMKRDGVHCYSAVFRGFGALGRHGEACLYFGSVLDKEGVTEELRSAYLDAYVRGTSFKQTFAETLKRFRYVIEKFTIKPSIDVYKVLISQSCKEGQVHQALDLLQEAHGRGLQLSAEVFQPLLLLFVEGIQYRPAMESFAAMQRMGVQPSFDTFSCLIRVCGKAHEVEKMFELLREMKRLGIRRTSEIYNAMIQAFGRAKRFSRALEMLQEMEEDNLKPDSISYTELISASPDSKVAMELFNKMKRHGITVTDSVLSHLFSAMVKDGELDQAIEMLRDPDAARIGLGAKSSLLAGLADAHRVEEALVCFEDIRREGRLPEPYAYGHLIEALGYAGNLDRMLELYEMSFVNQWRKRDDTFVEELQIKCCMYVTKACLLHNELGRLEAFLQKAKEAEYVEESAIFDSIILTIAEGGDPKTSLLNFSWEDGFKLLELMHKLDIPASRTFLEALLDGCIVLRDVERGEGIVQEMERSGLHLNVFSYIRLLRLFVVVENVDKAAGVLKLIKNSLEDEDVFLLVGEILNAAQPAVKRMIFNQLELYPNKP